MMINNLSQYFVPEHEYYLDTINYERLLIQENDTESLLKCNDQIKTKIKGDYLNLSVTRNIYFEPEGIFRLSVTYGANLKFIEEKKDEYDWSKIDLEEEFRSNGQFVLVNLLNRISLLVAEITSSYGLSPLVLPPGLLKPGDIEKY